MQEQIFIYRNDVQEGPYTPQQIQGMLSSGMINSVCPVWKDGMADWSPLNIVFPEYFGNQTSPDGPTLYTKVPSVPTASATGPKGVGGWLLLFCISLTILSPLAIIGTAIAYWGQLDSLYIEYPSLKTASVVENAISFILGVYSFIAGVIIWSGSKIGRTVAKQYIVSSSILLIVGEITAILLIKDVPGDMMHLIALSAWKRIMQQIAFFFVWWLYFKKSKRVLNTYGPID